MFDDMRIEDIDRELDVSKNRMRLMEKMAREIREERLLVDGSW